MEKPSERVQEAILKLRSQMCPCGMKPEHTVGWCEALKQALGKGVSADGDKKE